ncbi:hypothetical protein DFH06DRAFT_1143055 [Mycena polygramma]|nr:hypothetical protein DFH06DRAFT_1143055 [Mycena polygramma]
MPSFSQITLLATVALAAFISAAPITAQANASADMVPLPAIITQLVGQLGPLTDALFNEASIDASNATTDVVGPIATQIQGVITGAVGQVSALAGCPVSTILATADGVISATDVAQLLAPVFTTVFDATEEVLKIVGSSPVAPLINDILCALDPLLSATAPLVNGLMQALGPILGPAVKTLDAAGLGPVVGLIGTLV